MTSANPRPGGYKFAPLVASQQGRANQHEHACFELSSPWSVSSRFDIRLHAVVQPWLSLQRSILPRNVPSLVTPFCAIPPRPGLAVHWSALIPKALRSSRKHLIYSFSWPPTQPASSTNSPNITHFGSLVSSMRATNPANKIRLLRKVASMLSLPVLMSVSKIGNRVVGAIALSPTNAASLEPVVGSAQRVVVARARAPSGAAVQQCLEYPGS